MSNWDTDDNTSKITKEIKIVHIQNSNSMYKIGEQENKPNDMLLNSKVYSIMEKKYPDKINELDYLSDAKVLSDSLVNSIKDTKNFDKDTFIKRLEKIREICNKICIRYNMPDITYNKDFNKKLIPRNSYDFCDNTYECTRYNFKKCNRQHFPYNYILCDLNSVINYLTVTEADNLEFSELAKSIKTICFVISHMNTELSHRLNKTEIGPKRDIIIPTVID